MTRPHTAAKPTLTSRGRRMSRAPTLHSGRSGNPEIMGSSIKPMGLKPGQVKPNTLKLILVASQPGARHYLDRIMIGWLAQCPDNVTGWDSRS